MCDERERLIGYVYDECDAGEKRLVEAHLQTCETCREEIGGLRRVRTDLLAWDVPDHGSAWTPDRTSASDGRLLQRVIYLINASEGRQIERVGDLHNFVMNVRRTTDSRMSNLETGLNVIASQQSGGK